MDTSELSQSHYLTRAAASLALLLLAVVARALAHRALGRSRLPMEVRQRWLSQLRTTAVLIVLVGLVAIWTDELRELALSIAAIAVAFVVATKELLLCLTGSFIRTGSRAFALGDRIEVLGIRGDVVEVGGLTTTLLEVNRHSSRQTGRSVVLPNSVFVANPVHNETFAGDYGLHSLRVPLPASDDWRLAESRLLEAAHAECKDHEKRARRYVEDVAWRKGLGPDAVEPQVTIELPDEKRIDLVLRFPTPARARGRVEQAILKRYLDALAAEPASPARAMTTSAPIE